MVEGIENAPKAFIGLFKGENFGKMLVKVGPDPGLYKLRQLFSDLLLTLEQNKLILGNYE